jgi:hypothetical protein
VCAHAVRCESSKSLALHLQRSKVDREANFVLQAPVSGPAREAVEHSGDESIACPHGTVTTLAPNREAEREAISLLPRDRTESISDIPPTPCLACPSVLARESTRRGPPLGRLGRCTHHWSGMHSSVPLAPFDIRPHPCIKTLDQGKGGQSCRCRAGAVAYSTIDNPSSVLAAGRRRTVIPV